MIATLPEMSDFSQVAHDLGTPLSAMLGHLQLLETEHLSTAGRRRLEIIEGQVRRMSRLIQSQLLAARQSFDRAGVGVRMADGILDVHEVIRTVLSELDVVLHQRGIRVSVIGAARVDRLRGDADAVHRVLVNVLTNAADAMPAGGHIRVAIRSVDPPAATVPSVAIEVVDTGSGILPELQRRIFEPRVTTKAPGDGSGLGLVICRQIAEAHGGRIEIASEVGKGTRVRVLLPRQAVSGSGRSIGRPYRGAA
jgi:signal transduction histidine kinase